MLPSFLTLAVFKVYEATGRNKSHTVDILQKLRGYESFSRTVLQRWDKKDATAKREDASSDDVGSDDDEKTDKKSPSWAVPVSRGRPVNKCFEDNVMSGLVIVAVKSTDKAARADESVKADPSKKRQVFEKMVANVMINYTVIRIAAKAEQEKDLWKDDKAVKAL